MYLAFQPTPRSEKIVKKTSSMIEISKLVKNNTCASHKIGLRPLRFDQIVRIIICAWQKSTKKHFVLIRFSVFDLCGVIGGSNAQFMFFVRQRTINLIFI